MRSVSYLDEIDSVVATGKAVIGSSDQEIVDILKEAIGSGRSASYYLPRDQAEVLREWYWTPERIKITGITQISVEETERIRDDLSVNVTNFRFAPFTCECGSVYGAFDFLQQGIREHGLETVTAIFSLKHSTFFQVNPNFIPVCPSCDRRLSEISKVRGWAYDCDQYGGCYIWVEATK